ncbi:MAG: alpha/beta hydrolase family protein, partial [Archangium sp.]
SAGGTLALWAAARRDAAVPLAAVVGQAPPTDLEARARGDGEAAASVRALLGGPPDAVPDRYRAASPAALLPLGVRQVLVHGTEDTTVPLTLSTEYHARATKLGDPVRLVSLPGAEHFEVIDPRAKEWPRVVEAVASLL